MKEQNEIFIDGSQILVVDTYISLGLQIIKKSICLVIVSNPINLRAGSDYSNHVVTESSVVESHVKN